MKHAIPILAAALLAVTPCTVAWAQLGSGKGAGQTGGAQGGVTCNVASVDTSASSFECKNTEGSATYKVSSSTAFNGVSDLAALKAGMTVVIQYHASGGEFIADSVTAE